VESDELRLPRVQARVLRQDVLEALRSGILANRIKPGSRLLEADVATRMGVSRAPVREAIRQLEQEGLVEFFPHRGAVVIGLPEDEIDAIYHLRALIEERAIERACTRATEDDLKRLEGLIADMQAALKQRDIDELAELDLRFHGAIVELSGFSLLRHIWQSLDGLVRVRSYRALDRPGRAAKYFLSASIASHSVLVDAIRARDPGHAATAVRTHILEVVDRLHAGDTAGG
jgi:DNA-binding GntR family transcriptional regulator